MYLNLLRHQKEDRGVNIEFDNMMVVIINNTFLYHIKRMVYRLGIKQGTIMMSLVPKEK